MIILLFAILLVLLYATGLLPGVLKFIALVMGIVLVNYMASIYGWGIVIAGGAVVTLLAIVGIYLTFKWMFSEKKEKFETIPQDVLKARDAQAKQRSDMAKEEIMRKQREITDSIGKD